MTEKVLSVRIPRTETLSLRQLRDRVTVQARNKGYLVAKPFRMNLLEQDRYFLVRVYVNEMTRATGAA